MVLHEKDSIREQLDDDVYAASRSCGLLFRNIVFPPEEQNPTECVFHRS